MSEVKSFSAQEDVWELLKEISEARYTTLSGAITQLILEERARMANEEAKNKE